METEKPTDGMAIGEAIHKMMLEGMPPDEAFERYWKAKGGVLVPTYKAGDGGWIISSKGLQELAKRAAEEKSD